MYKRLNGHMIKFCRHHCFLYWDIILHLEIPCKLCLGKTLFSFRFCILFSPNSSSKKPWETWKYPGYQSKSRIKTANTLLRLGLKKPRPHCLPSLPSPLSVKVFFPRLGVFTIYMEKPEIPVGKSNGSRHSVWEASGKSDRNLRRCNCSTLFSRLSWFV